MIYWFAAMTKPRQEWLVHGNLRRQGYDALFLHYRDETRVGPRRERVPVNRAYFPRYVFVGLQDGQGLYGARKTIGVATIVHNGERPLQIPDSVIGELQTKGVCINGKWHTPDIHGYIHLEEEERERFKAGQQVRIISGPLQGLIATVSLDEGPQVRLWLNLFRGRVPVTVAPEVLQSATRFDGGAIAD